MKKKEEKKYIDKEWRATVHHLKAFIKKGEQESLHRFRTGVKKLRAFFTLAESVKNGQGIIKPFKPVRKVFKQAGEIRNAYINTQLGKSQQATQMDFINGQEQIMNALAGQFKAEGQQHLATLAKVKPKLKKRIPKVPNLHIRLYYQQQLEHIAAGLQQHQFGEDLHACRKQIKMLIYNYHLVKPKLEQPFNQEYLEQVQTVIGNWHDNQVATDLFAAEAMQDEKAKTLLKKQAVALKKEVARLLKGFYERATTVTELPLPQVS